MATKVACMSKSLSTINKSSFIFFYYYFFCMLRAGVSFKQQLLGYYIFIFFFLLIYPQMKLKLYLFHWRIVSMLLWTKSFLYWYKICSLIKLLAFNYNKINITHKCWEQSLICSRFPQKNNNSIFLFVTLDSPYVIKVLFFR